MAKFLLDTNHLSHAIRRISPLRDRLRQAHRQGDKFGTCWPALCELEVGIRQTSDPLSVRLTLRTILKSIRIWPMNWQIVQAYGELRQLTKAQGRALSQVDLFLGSFSRSLNVTLLTTDNDFKSIEGIRLENWT
jgi:predicted nucleic acid-binding protein